MRLANLFDPHASVLDAERWLLDLPTDQFNLVAATLGGFLEDERERQSGPKTEWVPLLRRERDPDELFWGGDRLRDLSDGYRAVVTLVCDILAGLGSDWGNLRNAAGIVLIGATRGWDERLVELRVELQSHAPVLGFTRRDQLVYEAIDEFLKEERSLDREVRQEERRKILERVKDLWRSRSAVLGDRA